MNEALQMGHASAQLALDFANREVNDWEILAMGWVRAVARSQHTLTASEVRDYAEKRGFPKAPDERAWGAIMRKSAKAGVIRASSEWRQTERKRSHGRPERVWLCL